MSTKLMLNIKIGVFILSRLVIKKVQQVFINRKSYLKLIQASGQNQF